MSVLLSGRGLRKHEGKSVTTVLDFVGLNREEFDFEPKIALGHGVLDYLTDFCSRHTALLDATLSILQVRAFIGPPSALTLISAHPDRLPETLRGASLDLCA